jgi:hypothetical protein
MDNRPGKTPDHPPGHIQQSRSGRGEDISAIYPPGKIDITHPVKGKQPFHPEAQNKILPARSKMILCDSPYVGYNL